MELVDQKKYIFHYNKYPHVGTYWKDHRTWGECFTDTNFFSFSEVEEPIIQLDVAICAQELLEEVKRLQSEICFLEGGTLQAENERLRKALQDLYDEQNGPPLLTREKQWNEAMRQADELLASGADGEPVKGLEK